MNKKSVNDKEMVMTGQYLGVVEEFLPDKHSTFVKDGEIFSTKIGVASIDKNKREIEVKPLQEEDRKTVRIGDTVIGTILFLRLYSIGVSFHTINNKLHFNSAYMGNVHVSEISNKYVEKIQDAFQITDVIRAKIIGQEFNEYKLSTKGKNFGVVHAECLICGTELEKEGFNKLQCPRCGNVEYRKLADDYRNVKEKLRY